MLLHYSCERKMLKSYWCQVVLRKTLEAFTLTDPLRYIFDILSLTGHFANILCTHADEQLSQVFLFVFENHAQYLKVRV